MMTEAEHELLHQQLLQLQLQMPQHLQVQLFGLPQPDSPTASSRPAEGVRGGSGGEVGGGLQTRGSLRRGPSMELPPELEQEQPQPPKITSPTTRAAGVTAGAAQAALDPAAAAAAAPAGSSNTSSSSSGGGGGVRCGALPDLGLRGHSASSLDRMRLAGDGGCGGGSGVAAAGGGSALGAHVGIVVGGPERGDQPEPSGSMLPDFSSCRAAIKADSGGEQEVPPLPVLSLPVVPRPELDSAEQPCTPDKGTAAPFGAASPIAAAAGGPGGAAAAGAAVGPTTPAVAAATSAAAGVHGGAGGGGGGCGCCGGGNGHHRGAEKGPKWIYVVDPELRLFVHPKVRGRFHHSSFLRGGAVVAAGGLAARHGQLRLLTADSGHYWPREENFRWLCEHLVSVGADLSACELRSKHMRVPAATGRELMERLGVPPPAWQLQYLPPPPPPPLAPLECGMEGMVEVAGAAGDAGGGCCFTQR
ncbi:hypothetical protein Agub_g11254 [Astrephomene gubernaculifera]|uniref:Uncharacterized protein n=1 Tax=Astrephomene gubernaculifera TaxID=47775 RepID=A0AAD3DWA1_9CHLO|nr:hypothetical protein Agub_g11254 [Astrephomene gubernaculifera]